MKKTKEASVQFSRSVVSDSLRPHGLQHTRLPCASPAPRACSGSCPSSWWCHQPFPRLLSPSPPTFNLSQYQGLFHFSVTQFFASGGQSIVASASASVLPMNIQGWFPLGLTSLISLQSKGLSSLLQHYSSKSISSLALSFLYSPTLTSIHDHWKNHSLE